MRHTTTIRSWPATLLAGFFALVTARVLLDDVAAGAPFTTQHIASIAALVAAVAAGHYVWPALREGAVLSALLLALVAASATAYTVVSSGMRNAENAASKAAGADKARTDRAAAESEWRRLDAELQRIAGARSTQAVRAAMDAVVGTGDGKVPLQAFRRTAECTDITKAESVTACGPLLKLRIEMADAIRKHELEPAVAAARARLEAMRSLPPAAAGFTHAARVIAALPFVTVPPAELAQRLELLMPFLSVLIGEFGTMGFAALGLGRRRAPVPVPRRSQTRAARFHKGRAGTAQSHAGTPVELEPANDHAGPGSSSTGSSFTGSGSSSTGSSSTDPEAVHRWVREFRRRNGRDPQIPEVQAEFHAVPRTTAWRRIKAA